MSSCIIVWFKKFYIFKLTLGTTPVKVIIGHLILKNHPKTKNLEKNPAHNFRRKGKKLELGNYENYLF